MFLLLWGLLPQACSDRDCWFRPATSEVTDLCPVLQRSLAEACSLSGGSLVPAAAEVVASGLLCSGHWLQPTPVVVAASGLLLKLPFKW